MKKPIWFDIYTLFLIFLSGIVIIVFICLISDIDKKSQAGPPESGKSLSPVLSTTDVGYGLAIATVKHDDHLFLVFKGDDKVLINHPDCPKCKK